MYFRRFFYFLSSFIGMKSVFNWRYANYNRLTYSVLLLSIYFAINLYSEFRIVSKPLRISQVQCKNNNITTKEIHF